ncbi:hypothetical protein BDW42DRAFT_175202, partial [Aspergillus taichungensis]
MIDSYTLLEAAACSFDGAVSAHRQPTVGNCLFLFLSSFLLFYSLFLLCAKL